MTRLLLEDDSLFAFEDGSFWELEEIAYGSPFGQASTIPSDRWDRTLRGPHRKVTRVEILRAGEVIFQDLAVTDGEVTWDRRAALYGRATVQLAEPLLIGSEAADPLTPYGNEFRIWSGIMYGSRDVELESLITCPIRASSTNGVTLLTQLEGFDRSQRVAWARLEDDYVIEADTNYATAIHDLIDAGVPGLTYRFASTAFTTPDLVIPRQADRWATAVEMARKCGMALFFDGLGDVTLANEPDPRSTAAVDTFADGGVLLDAEIAMDRESTFNVVCVESSNADQTEVFKATAVDDDPASPTYAGGPYGRQSRFYASPFIASAEQAQAAARSILTSESGVPKSYTFTVVPNPRRRPGDVVHAQCSALGLDGLIVIDDLTIGLGPEAVMTGSARSRWETDLTVA